MKTYKTRLGPDVTVESAYSMRVGDETVSFKRDADVIDFCADYLSKIPCWRGDLDETVAFLRKKAKEFRR